MISNPGQQDHQANASHTELPGLLPTIKSKIEREREREKKIYS